MINTIPERDKTADYSLESLRVNLLSEYVLNHATKVNVEIGKPTSIILGKVRF